MGDYVIHVNGKSVITACDNNAFVKKLPCIAVLMADAECGCPYPGAKEAISTSPTKPLQEAMEKFNML